MAITRESALAQVLGDRTQRALKKAFGYTTVGQLLEHYPRRYATRGELTSLQGIALGEPVSLVAEVVSVTDRPMRNKKGSLLEVVITDGTGVVTLTFFNQAWRARDLRPGARGIFAGKVSSFRGGKQLAHPDYELFEDAPPTEESSKAWAQTPIPIYPATSTLASWQIQKAISTVLDQLEGVEDPVPDELKSRHTLVDLRVALEHIHRPESESQWQQARDTLRFHEALVLQLALLQQRAVAEAKGTIIREPGELGRRFRDGLPFSLTDDQQAVATEIASDLASGVPMHRLIQGEVGSGKTVVALGAIVQVAEDGGQSALLAPTEVLASQHFRSIVNTLGPDLASELAPTLLTGGMGAKERKKAELMIASGQSRIVVGTHALLSDSTQFHDLGLVVVDEQHRFGVTQRDVLRHKGSNPHVLVLTATPIPRTVAMTVFGDVDISTIRGVPAGRQPVTTHVVALAENPAWFSRVWQRADEEIEAGHRVFVVAPAIDQTGVTEGVDDGVHDGAGYPDQVAGIEDGQADGEPARPLTAVLELAATLKEHELLGKRQIGVVHGRLDSKEKDEVMAAFHSGDLDLLVATTVIEVGVDVPQATMMIVMDADRFGISQLHQLRGRIGRGGLPGVCLLVTHQPAESMARQRLDAVASTTDGFELARIDMELRREGDVLGANQSGGRSGLKLVRVSVDGELIESARADAKALLAASPDVTEYPGLRKALADRLQEIDADYLDRS